MCELNTKITIVQLLRLTIVSAKSKIYSPRRGYLSPGNSIVLGIAATLLFISVTTTKILPYHISTHLCKFVKMVLRPKKQFFFSLDFKTMLTKHQLRKVLSSDFKKTPVYFNWNFLIYWSAITNFKILRELGRGKNYVKDSLV